MGDSETSVPLGAKYHVFYFCSSGGPPVLGLTDASATNKPKCDNNDTLQHKGTPSTAPDRLPQPRRLRRRPRRLRCLLPLLLRQLAAAGSGGAELGLGGGARRCLRLLQLGDLSGLGF